MIYIPDSEIERFLLEDIALGDLTTRSLKLTECCGTIEFMFRHDGIVSAAGIAARILQKLGLVISTAITDGQQVAAGQVVLSACGNAAALHQGWKVAQNILEWCSGVAQTMSLMLSRARKYNPMVQIACTRKSIPGTRLLATQAILDGGGIIHRCGTAETILVFANHRGFFPEPFDWATHIAALRQQAPEKKIVVEADTPDEALCAMAAQPDIVQLDKFTVQQIEECLAHAQKNDYRGLLAAAGGIHPDNIDAFAATGIPLIVTSAPYYAKPADIRVLMMPVQ